MINFYVVFNLDKIQAKNLNKTQIDTNVLKKFLDYLQEQFNGRIKNKAL